MSLLKLAPACVEYLWGGHRLIDEFGKSSTSSTLGETWELSCHPDGMCHLANGPLSGKTLGQFFAENPAALGENCQRFGGTLPVLIKFIDAAKALSIQVHPSDDYAWQHEGQAGKTEVWYIVDCAPGSFLYYGVDREVTREEFSRALAEGTILPLLRKVPVKKGETYFVPAGTIHAIGADILIAEIQQSSNVTYRLFDFNRKGADGKLRPLHLEKSAAVSNLTPSPRQYDFGGHLALCNYFCVDKLELAGEINGCAGSDSFVSLLVTGGSGTLSCGTETLPFAKGDSLLLTAGSGDYRLAGNGELLCTTIPK